jgi:uncharacterized protein GlcG (DUF336 family)
MISTLAKLRKECVIAFVGGSDLVKIEEQLISGGVAGESSQSEDKEVASRTCCKGGTKGEGSFEPLK